jgi:DNA-binding FadR family transcriptional regulator
VDSKEEQQTQVMDIIVRSIGKRLPTEKILAEKLGISRPAVREILKGFEANGIISVTKGSGRYVQTPDVSGSIVDGWTVLLKIEPGLLSDLLEVRSTVELGFLTIAVESLEIKDLMKMRDLVERMKALASMGESFIEEDKEFHNILFSRVGNVLLDQLLRAFWGLFEKIGDDTVLKSVDLIMSAQIHERLLQAIGSRNLVLSKKLLEEQFLDIENRLRKIEGK